MGYRIRVLGTNDARPSLKSLQLALQEKNSSAVLKLEAANKDHWEQLVLSHPSGPEIALIECNPVIEGELGHEELEGFIEEVGEAKPFSAAQWLKGYLPTVQVIYAMQMLSGTDVNDGWKAVHTVQNALWKAVGGILQSDSEGFSNEDGYYVLWQFNDNVAGRWNMAVLDRERWVSFEMDLGNLQQRAEFMEGRIPAGVRLL